MSVCLTCGWHFCHKSCPDPKFNHCGGVEYMLAQRRAPTSEEIVFAMMEEAKTITLTNATMPWARAKMHLERCVKIVEGRPL